MISEAQLNDLREMAENENTINQKQILEMIEEICEQKRINEYLSRSLYEKCIEMELLKTRIGRPSIVEMMRGQK